MREKYGSVFFRFRAVLVFVFSNIMGSYTVRWFKVVREFSVMPKKRAMLALKECKQIVSSRSGLQIFYKPFEPFALSSLLVEAVLYWPVSILLILKDQSGIICDPTHDIYEVPQASKQELIIPTRVTMTT